MIIVALSVAGPVCAQEALNAEGPSESVDVGADDIIVTAQFRAQNLQDTPLAITAVTGDQLEQRGQTNITGIAAKAPNVSIQPASNGFGPAALVSIRGIGQQDSSLAFEPGVGIYIDDVYYSTVFGSAFELLDLDRVEILRGPQGTLAGKNSVGGAIKLYSKKPNGDPNAFIEAMTGSFNLLGLRAGANFTLVPDKIHARISGIAKHQRGYVARLDYACDNPGSPLPTMITGNGCVLGREGGNDLVSLRGALNWAVTEGIEVNIIGDYSNSVGDPAPNVLTLARATGATLNGVAFGPGIEPKRRYISYGTYVAPAASNFNPVPRTELEQWGVSGDISVELSDGLSLKSITAYRRTIGSFVQDGDGSPFQLSVFFAPTRQRQFTQELRLDANLLDAIDVTLGGFYFDAHGSESGRTVSGFLDFIRNDQIKSKNKSVFAHASWHVTDALNVTGGIRYSDETKTFSFIRSTTNGIFSPFVSPINGLSGTFSGGRWDYRAAVDYRWSDQILTYAQISTGFKGGGINPRPFFTNQVAPFDQETVTAFEIGIKTDLLDRRLRLNLAAFINKYKNIQTQSTTPYFNLNLPVQPDPALPNYNPAEGTFPSGVYLNAGDAEMRGVEAELTLRPVDGLTIDASLSYLDDEYKRLAPQAVASSISLAMDLPLTPKWKGSLGVQYELPLGGSSSLTPRIDYSYQSATFAAAVNAPRNRLDERNNVNARLTYKHDENWEAAVSVTNLTKEYYFVGLQDLYTIGYVVGTPVRPREWSVSLKRRF